MSIRPVEFNGMIQRTQDIGTMKSQEDAKPFVDQQNLGIQQQKQQERQLHKVSQSEKKQDSGKKKYDAKEKGSNEYEDRHNKDKDKDNRKDDNAEPSYTYGAKGVANRPSFDMKI
jgi:hypothetical protein